MNDLDCFRHDFIPPTRRERFACWLDHHPRLIWTGWAVVWMLLGSIMTNFVWLMMIRGLAR